MRGRQSENRRRRKKEGREKEETLNRDMKLKFSSLLVAAESLRYIVVYHISCHMYASVHFVIYAYQSTLYIQLRCRVYGCDIVLFIQ